MNIRTSTDSHTAPASAIGAVRSDSASANGPRPETARPASAAEGDRVEISAAARAQADAAPEAGSLELELARHALRSGSELDAARLHQLRERVRTGYYDQPTVIDRIAEAAARELVEGA